MFPPNIFRYDFKTLKILKDRIIYAYKEELKIHLQEQINFNNSLKTKKRENYIFDKENLELKIISNSNQ